MSRATICQRSMLIPRVQLTVKSFIDLMRVGKVKSFIILAGIRAAVVIRQSRLLSVVLSGISSCCRVSCPMQCECVCLYLITILHINRIITHKIPHSLAWLATYKCSTFLIHPQHAHKIPTFQHMFSAISASFSTLAQIQHDRSSSRSSKAMC